MIMVKPWFGEVKTPRIVITKKMIDTLRLNTYGDTILIRHNHGIKKNTFAVVSAKYFKRMMAHTVIMKSSELRYWAFERFRLPFNIELSKKDYERIRKMIYRMVP